MNTVILFVIYLVVFAAMDFLWLGFVVKGYQAQIGELSLLSSPGARYNWFAIIVTYFLLALAPFLFIFRYAHNETPLSWFLIQGALLGLTIYGIYEFTNWSVLRGWNFSMVVLDTIWGIILYSVTVTLVGWIGRYFSLLQ